MHRIIQLFTDYFAKFFFRTVARKIVCFKTLECYLHGVASLARPALSEGDLFCTEITQEISFCMSAFVLSM